MNTKLFFLLLFVNILYANSQVEDDGEEDIYTIEEHTTTEEVKKKPYKSLQPTNKLKGKLFTGGGIGLNFGTTTLLQIAPTFGYIFKKRLLIGLNVNVSYLNAKSISFSTYTYSGGLFTRAILHDYFFIQAELEAINYEPIDISNIVYSRRSVPSLFVGGGLRQEMSERATFNIALLYNLMQRGDTPYPNPLIRTGIIIVF